MNKIAKKRALCSEYVSPRQMVLTGFETPFERVLYKNNRWVVMSHLLPWNDICSIYFKTVKVSETGRPILNPRIILGSLIIKHLCNLDDRETVSMISENVYMQYFLGYSSFTGEPPFDASLFVEIRKRLGQDTVNQFNERIGQLKKQIEQQSGNDKAEDENDVNSLLNQSKSENFILGLKRFTETVE